jgi:hypothetical protein
MSNKNESLLELKLHLIKIIKESGDLENIEAYPYKNNKFETEEGWKVQVSFKNLPEDYYDYFNLPMNTVNVGYSIEGNQSQYEKTTYSKLIKVLKTVSDITINYAKQNKKIEGLTFFAANKQADKLLTHTDSQKTSIYKAIVLNRISKLGSNWTVRDLELDSGYKGFLLYKNKK